MKPTVSGKAKERWERRSSPNSALSCSATNSSVEGSRAWVFEGGGVSVATESPRVADAVVTGIGGECPRAPCPRSRRHARTGSTPLTCFRTHLGQLIAGQRLREIASACTARHVPARAAPASRAVSFPDDVETPWLICVPDVGSHSPYRSFCR